VGKFATESYWIEHGQLVLHSDTSATSADADEERLHRLGHVRVVTGPLGSEVKWSTFAPCHASLFAAMELLAATARPPVILRYYLSGWFEETGLTIESARHRIDYLMQRGDRRLEKKTFIFSKLIENSSAPPLIRKCWIEGRPSPDHAVDCIYHQESGHYFVERIGPQSAIAKHFGTSTITFPCQSSNSYGETVSEAYAKASATGKPVYDQVLASLPVAPLNFHWIPYHRLVFPITSQDGKKRVSVISEIAPIDFQVI
jgi:hypothetical protein